MLVYNRVALPRGYKHIIAEKLSSLSADYAFAVAYPDFNLGQFIYLNRIRNTFFYDFSKGYGIYRVDEQELTDGPENFSSFGTELLADFYILRLPFRFSAGLQTSYMPFEQDWHFRFLFNIDIYGFVLNGIKN
jgi:hypothetical protein